MNQNKTSISNTFLLSTIPVIALEWIGLVMGSPLNLQWFTSRSILLLTLISACYFFAAGLLVVVAKLGSHFPLKTWMRGILYIRSDHALKRLIQGLCGLAVPMFSLELIKLFQRKFHDQTMIGWSLFIIIGTLVWLTLILILFLEKPILTRQDKSKRWKHPLILPGYLILLAIVLNLRWIQHIIDLKLFLVIGLWLIISVILKNHYPKTRWSTPATLAAWMGSTAILMGTPLCCNNLLASINQFTIAPKYVVAGLEGSGIHRLLPQRDTDTKQIEYPKSLEDFDLIAWNRNNKQDYPYSIGPDSTLTGLGKNWNVILLSVDALRADHMSSYGYPLPTSPTLDKLAANGVLFERHYTQGGDSIYSLNSILSGVLPWEFQEQNHMILSELLTGAGYRSCYVGYDYVLKGGAFRSGFENVDLLQGDRAQVWGTTTSHTLINRIITMINHPDPRPFFVYCHLLDPHADYLKNDETDRFNTSAHPGYDGEIAYTDKEIGRLLEYLDSNDLGENTLLIVTADHGEAFNEHGHLWHGKFLYDESVRTPLIMNLPELENRRVKIPVGPVNIVPTILDFLGVSIPAWIQGQSLLPVVYHGKTDDLPAVEMFIPREKYHKRGWVFGPWKLIENTKQNTRELYHLENDPRELNNLFTSY